MLLDLLATWENWLARNTLTRLLSCASTDDTRIKLSHALADLPEVDPLDALCDAAKLVDLLTSWRWQAVHAARVSGASWDQIANATGTTAELARAEHEVAIERFEQHGIGTKVGYREAL